MRGIADFLVRVDNPSGDACSYEPVDAKLARTEAKPGHVLQLCFYADALRAATGATPERLHIWLGSGRIESLVSRRNSTPTGVGSAASCVSFLSRRSAHAGDPARTVCPLRVLRVRRHVRRAVARRGLPRLRRRHQGERPRQSRGLGHLDAHRPGGVVPARWPRCVPSDSSGWSPKRSSRSKRGTTPTIRLPFRPIEAGADPTWGRGLELLPEPDDGDVFLDFEGDPFWTADVACSSSSGSSPAMPTASGPSRPDGRTTGPGRSGRPGSSSSTCRIAGPRTRTCTSTTTTTRSDRRSSAWPPITASVRRR